MLKIVLQEWVTIDSFAADENGGLDFFENSELNKYSDNDLLKRMEDFDTILLGANTYKMFADYWPDKTTDEEVIADKLNETKKLVFSKSLDSAPWGKWPAAQIVKTDAVETLKKFKQQPGKDMVLWGSLSLAQNLIKADLIDEYELRICPSFLGKGRQLFPEEKKLLNLKLTDSKIYESGLVMVKYVLNN